MKSPDNTEMDRLLRRYARRSGEALRAGGGATEATGTGDHLDADELNAYAEGALPEATRPRYFAHLADCDTCRKLVTELTLAAGVANEAVARPLAADAQPSKSWREWLKAIFSPPVLRYAVPALMLFAVVIVAIVAMRSQRDAGSVAQRNDEYKYSAPPVGADSQPGAETTTATGNAENHANSNIAPLAEQPSPMQPGITAAPELAKTAPAEADAPPVAQPTPAKTAVAQPIDSTDIRREGGKAGERAQQEVVDAAPPPPTTPAPTTMAAPAATEYSVRDKQEERKASKTGKDDADEMVASGGVGGAAAKNKAGANEDRREQGRATTTARSVQSLPRQRPSAPANMASEKESSSSTRRVGGRRFRKDGGAWVDTEYNPSRSTTNVRRGSEQYRALVADEPTLRAIAEELDGEVFVIWKRRAYRFY